MLWPVLGFYPAVASTAHQASALLGSCALGPLVKTPRQQHTFHAKKQAEGGAARTGAGWLPGH